MADDFVPGLEGVVAFETTIAEPDKDGGALRYRGVDIEDLVGRVTFGNVWALLVDGAFGPGLPPAEPFPVPVHTGDVRVDVQAALAMLAPIWGLRLVDVEQLAETPCRGEHRERALHVDPDVAGVHRQRERLGRGQAGAEAAVDQQRPHVAEGDLAREVLDVDAPVAQRTAVAVRFGDLGVERDHTLQPGAEAVVWFGRRVVRRFVLHRVCHLCSALPAPCA